MYSLIKIRLKYVLRNKFRFILSYFLIPLVLLIFSSYFSIGFERHAYTNSSFESFTECIFNNTPNIITTYFNQTSLLVKNEDDCLSLQTFIFNETNTTLKCINSTEKIEDISIIFNNKNNKYTFDLIGKQSSLNKIFNFSHPKYMCTEYYTELLSIIDYISKDNYNELYKESYQHQYKIYLEFQTLFAKYLILQKSENKALPQVIWEIETGISPYPSIDKKFHGILDIEDEEYMSFLFSFIISFHYSLFTYFFIVRIVEEKEKKLDIFLEKKGISKFVYFTSWFICYSFICLIQIFFLSFLFMFIIILNIYVFIYLILFSFSLFSISFFFASCISSIRSSSSIVKLFNFSFSFLGFIITFPGVPKPLKIIFAFFPQINSYLSINWIKKINTFNISDCNINSWEVLGTEINGFSYLESILMYLINIVFFIIIGIIIQLYNSSGLNLYQFSKSIFTKVYRRVEEVDSLMDDDKEENILLFYKIHHQELSDINKLKQKKNECLKFINVTKNFDSVKAVDNFNAELFSDEIFCLLGNNGAGKTTLINMISRIIKPTHGDIYLNDTSIVTNKSLLYQNIGLCQQEDVFFEYLTVEEHLEYIYKIKGNKVNKNEIEDLIKRINLNHKKKYLCGTLSGGEIRKLCIALALIGNSKIVLLDEPTSGVDIISKKEIWKFLKDYKKQKIILLTTHSLDEAEYLGDRIGILYNGKFVCSGTSSYLKSNYFCGYNINLLVNQKLFDEANKIILLEKLKKLDNDVSIRMTSKEIFSINIKSTKNGQKIINCIENSKEEFGIKDYTLTYTSLEDVFLKIINVNNLNDLSSIEKITAIDDTVINENIVKPTGFLQQLYAQIKRNLFPLCRNKLFFLVELLSGLGCLYIFMIILYYIDSIYYDGEELILYKIDKIDFIEILHSKGNYIYEYNKTNYFENSFLLDSDDDITKIDINNFPYTIELFMDRVSDNAFFKMAKGSIFLDRSPAYFGENLNIYLGRAFSGFDAFLYANTMFLISSILKTDYNIDAAIFTKIEFTEVEFEKNNYINIYKDEILLIVFCFSCLIGFIIFLSGLIQEKIKERINNIKHLLYLSGCNIWSYWTAFFVADFFKLMIFTLFLNFPVIINNSEVGYFWLIMIFICISSLMFIYSISFLFSKEDSGTKFILYIFFIFIFISVVFVILNIDLGEKNFIKYITSLFYLNPISSLILSFYRLLLFNLDSDSNFNYFKSNFKFDEISSSGAYASIVLAIQFLNFILYFLILVLYESKIFDKFKHYLQIKLGLIKYNNNSQVEDNFNKIEPFPKEIRDSNAQINNKKFNDLQENENNNNNIIDDINEQNDNSLNINNDNKISIKENGINPYIINEMEKVQQMGKFSTKIEGLTKIFWICCRKNIRAINNLYLCLEPNEKFGLLGYNGSGKTTTFKSITNEILYDSGKITLFGNNTQKEFKIIRKRIGYCPAINPLFDFMKVKEIIKFYLDLKTSEGTVDYICKKFGLEKYQNTFCVNLSGGNKRKLTMAIAIMNKPNILLLDEPSTGVDPFSKRILWKNINDLSNDEHNFNMILSTHSMEEAEMLCDRISWLKEGNFICVGNPEELKLQYSSGYILYIKFDDSVNGVNEVGSEEDIQDLYNKIASLVGGFNSFLNFITENKNIIPHIKFLFEVINKIKEYTKKIELNQIKKDFSFEFLIEIIPDKKQFLYSEMLNMKNNNPNISEIFINLPPLEDILTSFN